MLGEIHQLLSMLRLILMLFLTCVNSLFSDDVMAQSQRDGRTSEVWNEIESERFVSFVEELPQTGPLFGAWGEYETLDASAPPEPIATDRPDFTESSTTVGAGVVQIETGYTYSRNADDNVHGHSWGEPLLRVGVYADWLELRAALAPATEFRGGDQASGFEDLYLGMKLGLTSQSEWLPEVAIVPQMTVPSGHANFTANRTLPGCNLLYGWDVTDSLSTAGSTQVNLADNGDDAYVEWAQSWTVPYLWLRREQSPWLLCPAAISLALFAWLLTIHPDASGRVYAAYGGVYITVALAWLWVVDGVRPHPSDWIGVGFCLAGMVIIMLGPK